MYFQIINFTELIYHQRLFLYTHLKYFQYQSVQFHNKNRIFSVIIFTQHPTITKSAPTRYLTEVGEVLGQLNQPLNAELLFVGDTFVVFVALKDKCTQLKTKLEGQGLKVKQNPLKMPKGKTTDAEMVLATGLEQKVVDDLMKM
ncbi:Alanyl-tRNA_synthetase 3..2792 Trepomonas PC1 GDID01001169 [Hexamita inflata]|uniref:Alanyl-tRNA synthetase 3..2792 Trepomonas PC1 GDID01001169 n=1 Tax=Hexamita inflata TaxID=28002 RepID=A0AA86QPS0_9EUKA|nr:Alanyl-tRNA synthetase 3..2792 Trepomonas PC1 GDID01001169 [Hexamita inflata]